MSTSVKSTCESSGDVATVFRTLTAATWADHKARELNDGSRVVRREERPDGGVLFAVSRQLPDGVPGFLERFLPHDGRVLHTDDWAPAEGDARRGVWHVEVPGAPARLGGTMRIDPLPTGSRYTIEGEVEVGVPIIGGKAERFIAGMVEKLAAKEADLLRSMVGG